jgi:membrane peptidoglycan carboxypeptidase
MLWMALLTAMVGAPAGDAATSAPADLRALVERRMQCDHWSGEEAYDKARQRQIDAAVRRLRCDTVDRDESALRGKYKDRPDWIELIDAAAD